MDVDSLRWEVVTDGGLTSLRPAELLHTSRPEQSDICPSREDPVRSRVPEGSVVIALWMIPGSELAVASMQLGIHDSKKSTRFVGLARVVFDLSRCPQWHGAALRTHLPKI